MATTELLANYDALSFDCYGTLIAWEQGIGSVLSAWAKQAGLECTRESLLTAYSAHEARTPARDPDDAVLRRAGREFHRARPDARYAGVT